MQPFYVPGTGFGGRSLVSQDHRTELVVRFLEWRPRSRPDQFFDLIRPRVSREPTACAIRGSDPLSRPHCDDRVEELEARGIPEARVTDLERSQGLIGEAPNGR